MSGWIGVDLDGTLAEYNGWVSPEHIGPPVPAMVARVKAALAAGFEVRILTARLREYEAGLVPLDAWCQEHIGRTLRVTDRKDYGMIELWDDRAVGVEFNTGKLLSETKIKALQ